MTNPRIIKENICILLNFNFRLRNGIKYSRVLELPEVKYLYTCSSVTSWNDPINQDRKLNLITQVNVMSSNTVFNKCLHCTQFVDTSTLVQKDNLLMIFKHPKLASDLTVA